MIYDEYIDEDLQEAQSLKLLGRKPKRAEFKPWHRPHKQYIRKYQWLIDTARLVESYGEEIPTLRYLSLPGEDLLDIKYLGAFLYEQYNMNLFFYGYDKRADGKDAEFNSLEFSVKERRYIDSNSRIVNDDIRSLGHNKAKVRKDLYARGCFHVINLDLCQSVARYAKKTPDPNYFDAIAAMLQIQSRAPWNSLLLITTKIDSRSADEEALRWLFDIIIRLCEKESNYKCFKAGIRKSWNIEVSEELTEVLQGPVPITDEDKFLLGFIEWLIINAYENGVKPTVKSIKTYKTGGVPEDSPDDIASLSFGLEPILQSRQDPCDLQCTPTLESSLKENAEQIDGKSTHVPEKVKERERVDELLNTNEKEYLDCLQGTKDLLGRCGYDETAYEEWAKSERERS